MSDPQRRARSAATPAPTHSQGSVPIQWPKETLGFGHRQVGLLDPDDVRQVSDDGLLESSLGHPVYIPASQIAWIEVVPQ
jgi:hypothetical protein